MTSARPARLRQDILRRIDELGLADRELVRVLQPRQRAAHATVRRSL